MPERHRHHRLEHHRLERHLLEHHLLEHHLLELRCQADRQPAGLTGGVRVRSTAPPDFFVPNPWGQCIERMFDTPVALTHGVAPTPVPIVVAGCDTNP